MCVSALNTAVVQNIAQMRGTYRARGQGTGQSHCAGFAAADVLVFGLSTHSTSLYNANPIAGLLVTKHIILQDSVLPRNDDLPYIFDHERPLPLLKCNLRNIIFVNLIHILFHSSYGISETFSIWHPIVTSTF